MLRRAGLTDMAPAQAQVLATAPASVPVLVFGYGNPSRGDDALGPALIQRLADLQAAGPPVERTQLRAVELLTDFQLQPEHALDLAGRAAVFLVDADASLDAPYRLEPILRDQAPSYTTHEMSPGALLWVYARIGLGQPPPSFLLRIRGFHFALGDPLSTSAQRNLDLAAAFLLKRLTTAHPVAGPWAGEVP